MGENKAETDSSPQSPILNSNLRLVDEDLLRILSENHEKIKYFKNNKAEQLKILDDIVQLLKENKHIGLSNKRNLPKFLPKDLIVKGMEKSSLTMKYSNDDNLEKGTIKIELNTKSKEIKATFNNKQNINTKIQMLKAEIFNFEKSFLTTESEGQPAFNPIFIWFKKKNLLKKKVNIYNLINILSKANNKFLVFIFIEEDLEVKDKYEASLNKIRSIKKGLIESVLSVSILNAVMNTGKMKKIMMLFAKLLNIPKFYYIDDEIDKIYGIDSLKRKLATENRADKTFEALTFMSKVLNYGINDSDHEKFNKNTENKQEKTLKDYEWENTIEGFIQRDDDFREKHFNDKDYQEIKKICREKDNEKIELLLDLILLEKFNFKSHRKYDEVRDLLLMGKKKFKTLSEVSLMNSNFNEKAIENEGFYSRGTHRLGKPDRPNDYKLVLYNMDTINDVHPITDQNLFEENSFYDSENESNIKFSSRNDLTEVQKKKLELGYCNVDDIYYSYKIMNGLSGYIVFNYTYKISGKNYLKFLFPFFSFKPIFDKVISN